MSVGTVNSGINQLLDRLMKEDEVGDHERRSVHRTPFVRPVKVTITGTEQEMVGFSKNISPLGVGLIVENPIPDGTIATLTIHSLKNRPAYIRSELRWCKPFGNGWFLTGWKFMAELRG